MDESRSRQRKKRKKKTLEKKHRFDSIRFRTTPHSVMAAQAKVVIETERMHLMKMMQDAMLA
jgi:hypothetical protein